MKNYTYLFFVFIVISFTLSSCSKEEISQDITGVWKLVSIESYNCEDSTNNAYADYTNSECVVDDIDDCVEWSFDFKSDGIYTGIITIRVNEQIATETFEGTYTTTSDELEVCNGGTCNSGSIEDGKITINLKFIGPVCDADMVLERE